MARDNIVEATVTIRVKRTICNDHSKSAAREFLNMIQDEFGMVMPGPISVRYTDDNGDKHIETYNSRQV